MSKYLVLYCAYAIEDYQGHRNFEVVANGLAEAQDKALKEISERSVLYRGDIEFRVIEMGAEATGHRLWNRDKGVL